MLGRHRTSIYNAAVSKIDTKNLSENRRGRFDHEILETFEAGLVLIGQEVKSVKAGRMVIAGSYAAVRKGEVWLIGAQIPSYQEKNSPPDYDPTRSRKLLLNKSEINNLFGKLNEKGLTLIPLRVYIKKRLLKLELGLGRSRKAHDKRAHLKKREDIREMRKASR